MTKNLLAVLAVSTVLMACSNSGSSDNNGDYETFQNDFKPSQAPENAMVMSDIYDFSKALQKQSAAVPTDDVLLSTISRLGQIVNVDKNDSDVKRSWEKLSPEGQSIAQQIKRNCVLQNAVKKEGKSESPKKGAVSNYEIKSSISGDQKCPLNRNKKSVSVGVIDTFTVDSTGTGQMAGKQQTTETSSDTYSGSLLQASGVARIYSVTKMTSDMHGNYKNGNIISQNSRLQLESSSKINFANGEVVDTQIKTEFLESKKQMLMVFNTSRGVIKIVGLEPKGQESTWFLNGTNLSRAEMKKIFPALLRD